jgi:hypothetical protein
MEFELLEAVDLFFYLVAALVDVEVYEPFGRNFETGFGPAVEECLALFVHSLVIEVEERRYHDGAERIHKTKLAL